MHGVRPRTGWHNAACTLIAPLVPVIRRVAPRCVTTTDAVGRAMLRAARGGVEGRVVTTAEMR